MTENDVGNNVLGLGDDREMQRLIKMANVLATDNIKKKNERQSALAFDNISKSLQDVSPKSEIQKDTQPKFTAPTPLQNTTHEPSPNSAITPTNIQMFSIFGFKLPKSTLYFILVAIAVAVILYYWTSPDRSPSTDDADGDQPDTEQDE